ncbi:MAG: 5-(carboxyamino)imidazole ribonucleotide synthase [Firmicutes bacterium]|nr:5-(carboxyamino)imidazole ribonucleotide synthase [Bacillota bacterium]
MINKFDINAIKKIGIIGGGQLAKMMIVPAQRMGLEVYTLDPDSNANASFSANDHVVGAYSDETALRKLAALVGKGGVITFDLEHVGLDAVKKLEQEGYKIRPNTSSQAIIQDKYLQKEALKKAGIAVADFEKMEIESEIREWFKINKKGVLKSRRFSYDGYGNFVLDDEKDIAEGFKKLSKNTGGLYIEKWVPFNLEISVNVARGLNGEKMCYPLCENEHENNVLYTTIVPARVSEKIADRARELALKTADVFEGAGNLCVEMFLTKSGDILVNEVAPRPHNSGHFSIEACHVSQFENHIRGVAGLPLGDTELRDEMTIMLNILGDRTKSGKVRYEGVEKAMELGFSVHLYGKEETRPGRKMGHMTISGDREKLLKIYENIENVRIKATT